jgi:membrane protein required for colicin V production
MIWADWVIIAIFGLSCLVGLVRGLVREALSVAIWVAAALIAKVFGLQVSFLLTDAIETPSLRVVTAYAMVFIAVLLLGAMLSYLLGTLVRATGLSGTDRLLGILFGALRGFIIVMALVILLPGILPVKEDSWWNESTLLPYFIDCEIWVLEIYGMISQWISELWSGADEAVIPTGLLQE